MRCEHKYKSGKSCGRKNCKTQHGKQTDSKRADGTFAKGNNLGNRFKKGESGNPKGKEPGTKNVSTLLIEMLEDVAPIDIINTKFVKEFAKSIKKPTNAHAAACRIFYEALVVGEPWAIKELMDRTEGKSQQLLDINANVNLQTNLIKPKIEDE